MGEDSVGKNVWSKAEPAGSVLPTPMYGGGEACEPI
jgi:hypothetical protein